MQKIDSLQPVLKWAGGKRQLLNEICPRMPKEYNRYYEPFLGGGALLFHCKPEKATINDFNIELINMYKVIKEQPEELVKLLKKHVEKHSKEHFYEVRKQDRNQHVYENLNSIKKAARTIYLNKTCYNGLFRISRQGYFNTPIGKYVNPKIVNEKVIYAISFYLNSNDIKLLNGDYKTILSITNNDDFVYLDPPYYPISKTSSFTDYTAIGFNNEEHIKLKNECDKLNNKGVKFLLSNSNCDYISNLYKDYTIDIVSVNRFINSKANKRINATEVLIRNY